MALFFNKEADANTRFNAIRDSYTASRDAALKAAGAQPHPLLLRLPLPLCCCHCCGRCCPCL